MVQAYAPDLADVYYVAYLLVHVGSEETVTHHHVMTPTFHFCLFMQSMYVCIHIIQGVSRL